MNIRSISLSIIFLLIPLTQVKAEQAYTWVDENGTTHFSETPPHNKTLSAEEINLLPAPAAGKIVGDDFYSVTNQADRMKKERLEYEKLVAERLQAEAEARKASSEAQATEQSTYKNSTQDAGRFYPAYPYYPHDGFHPDHGHQPQTDKPVLPTQRPISALGRNIR